MPGFDKKGRKPLLQSPFRRLFIVILCVLLIAMLLLPRNASAHSVLNPTGPALNLETSSSSSSDEFRLTIKVNIFGRTVTVADYTITREQSELGELATESIECKQLDTIACANLALSIAQRNTSGVLSELIRLTKVFGNVTLCISTSGLAESSCLSGGQEVLREIMFGPPPISTGTTTTQSTPVPPTQPPAPTTIAGIDQFVGTWWIGGGAITLTIKSDGSATYVASEGNSQIQFTSVSGNTASGTVVSGTSIPIGPQGNSIPVGGTITVTLIDQHTLQVSNGYVLCPNTEQCAN